MTAQTPPSEQQEQAAWERIADNFDRYATPFTLALGEQALRTAGLRPGMRFLDVAAGTGALGIPAARLGARVTATDYSAAMVRRLAARARDVGLTQVESRVMDGMALEFPDGSFDLAGSQNGVSLFPDMARGLSEMARVVTPGGRVLVVAFGTPPPGAEFLSFFLASLRAAVPGFEPPPMDPPPPPFRLADPERMRAALSGAGLTDVRVEALDWHIEVRSAEHLWSLTTSSNPLAVRLVADLTEEHRAAARQVLDDMLRERAGDGPGAVLNSPMNVGVGTR